MAAYVAPVMTVKEASTISHSEVFLAFATPPLPLE